MKLSAGARTALRKELRAHPQITKHVTSASEVNRLSKGKLLSVAHAVGIDVKKISQQEEQRVERVVKSFMEDPVRIWSDQNPGFTGALEFDLTIEMFDRKIIRKARVNYSYTPEWKYFDIKLDKVMEGWPGSVLDMQILAVPERLDIDSGGRRRSRKYKPTWAKLDLAENGILPEDMWEDIYEKVDDVCRKEDARRRAQRKLPVDPRDLSAHEKFGKGLITENEFHRRNELVGAQLRKARGSRSAHKN